MDFKRDDFPIPLSPVKTKPNFSESKYKSFFTNSVSLFIFSIIGCLKSLISKNELSLSIIGLEYLLILLTLTLDLIKSTKPYCRKLNQQELFYQEDLNQFYIKIPL